MKVFVVLSLFVAASFGQNVCEDKEDGEIPAHGCRSYTYCFQGNPIQIDCPGNLVFDAEEGKCADPLTVPAPCGKFRDCTGKTGQYADLDFECRAFYTCNDGFFMGYQECNPGTIFDERDSSCTWPFLVPPPCGTCSDCDE